MAPARSTHRPPPLSEIILNTVRALIVGLDTDGTIRLFNDHCVEVTGWPREEALGVEWITQFVPPHARDRVLATFHNLLEGRGGIADEGPILTRQRGERLIQWRNAVVRDDTGRIVMVVGAGLDVTDARRTARQDALLSELNAGVLVGAPLPQVLARFLAALARLSGFEMLAVERFVAETDELAVLAAQAPANLSLWPAPAVSVEHALSGAAVRRAQPVLIEAGAPHPDARHPALQSLGVMTFHCYPIRAGDQVLGALSLASRRAPPLMPELHDYLLRVSDAVALVITRVEAVDRLTESEMRSRAVLDTAADGIITIDEQAVIQSFNPAAERLFGFAAHEVVGRSVALLMPPTAAGRHDDSVRRYLDTGTPRVIGIGRTATGRRKDGNEFPLDLTVSETRLPTGRRLFTGIVRDLTERVTLEAQLRHAQKMEAVGQLAGGMAHDFNNVLTGITGYTQLALSRLPADDPQCHYFEEIQRAAFRATNLTRQLLAFSRQQVLSPRVVDLGALVTDLSTLLRRLIGEDIDLAVHTPASALHVKADPGQIEQVIVNLAVNARDAMPAGGRLAIDLAVVDITESDVRAHTVVPPGRYALLSVSDTGTGMSDEVRARIFEPFFTTKEPGRGTGLGLATVYGIATQSRGHVRVESEVGRGSSFQIYLPRVEVPGAVPRRHEQGPDALDGSETILLVEDEDIVRAVNAEQLRSHGYHVLTAANAEEALQVNRTHGGAIDLLVTDVVMPRVNGRDLAALLARSRPHLKVLFFSELPQPVALPHGSQGSDAPFIEKPFSPGALARKVREVIDQ